MNVGVCDRCSTRFDRDFQRNLTGFMCRFEIKKNVIDKHPTHTLLISYSISPELVSQLPCIPSVSDFMFVADVPAVE